MKKLIGLSIAARRREKLMLELCPITLNIVYIETVEEP